MYGLERASKITRVTFSAEDTPVQVENGEPIYIYGVVLIHNTASIDSIITFETGNGSDVLDVHGVSARMYDSLEWCYLADKGLRIQASGANIASSEVVIFHSHSGT
jgi:hypothetical protein